MVVINISEETKERFRKLKLDVSAKEGKAISEDELTIILIDKFEGKKR